MCVCVCVCVCHKWSYPPFPFSPTSPPPPPPFPALPFPPLPSPSPSSLSPLQISGSQELVRNAASVWWFGHTFRHRQPHMMDHNELTHSMMQNRKFAEVHVHTVYMYIGEDDVYMIQCIMHIHVLMRDEKDGRKKQARSNKQQLRQSNTAHPRQSLEL